jgi:hypothetical protein
MVVAIKKSPQEPERRPAKKTNVVLSLKAPALPRERNHNCHQARRGLVEKLSLSETCKLVQKEKGTLEDTLEEMKREPKPVLSMR